LAKEGAVEIITEKQNSTLIDLLITGLYFHYLKDNGGHSQIEKSTDSIIHPGSDTCYLLT